MNNLKNVGQIVFAVPFAIFGIMHFMKASDMSGMVPSWVPGGVFWVYVIGLALLVAAISIVSKKQIYLASVLLAVLLFVFILTIHLPALIGGDQMAMPGLLKDMSLAGGALLIAGLFKDNG
ncbi:MAG: DoxX family protein [Planctomycetia bacterium]|nr:DoxX family protein [Planctomycetia bacterium]